MHGHFDSLFFNSFSPIVPFLICSHPITFFLFFFFFFFLIIHNQFTTMSHQVTPFFDNIRQNFCQKCKMCQNLYFAGKIDQTLSNSLCLTLSMKDPYFWIVVWASPSLPKLTAPPSPRKEATRKCMAIKDHFLQRPSKLPLILLTHPLFSTLM